MLIGCYHAEREAAAGGVKPGPSAGSVKWVCSGVSSKVLTGRTAACAGSGKSAIMREKLRGMDSEATTYTTINLNSFSDAPSVQTILEQPLEKKSGANFCLLEGSLEHNKATVHECCRLLRFACRGIVVPQNLSDLQACSGLHANEPCTLH